MSNLVKNIGDGVWHYKYGWGEISNIHNKNYVDVLFGSNDYVLFNCSIKELCNEPIPDNIRITVVEPFKPGDVVVVWNENYSNRIIKIFLSYKNGKYKVMPTNIDEDDCSTLWDNCLIYDKKLFGFE